jgi:folate-binding protein YgfZ
MSQMLQSECEALVSSVGFGTLRRSQIVISGKDRVRLLNGLTTNDIKRLQPGEGCESFLTNVQGKVIGHVNVFCSAETLVLDTVAGQAADLIRALDRYVIREDVRFTDQSNIWQEMLVSGAKAAAALETLFGSAPPSIEMQHADVSVQSHSVSIRSTSFAGPHSFQLSTSTAAITDLHQALISVGAISCSEEAIEIVRIESGTPLFGRDITADNLPQEVDRNARAISFTKGCYLGQETVARIDALGHVNRALRGLRFEGSAVPPVGAEITKDGKTIGKITSPCFSPRLAVPLALAYVRRGQDEVGNRMATDWGTAEVVQLPLQ